MSDQGTPPGYKQTEVGVIPEDWDAVSLGSIGAFKNGINKPAEAFGYGFPFVNLMDVFEVDQISTNANLGLLESSTIERKIYDLREGDVLFIRSSVKPSGVGLTTVITSNLQHTVFSGFLLRFRDGGQLAAQFKRYCFYDARFRDSIIASSTVSANTNINQSSLKKMVLAIPPTLPEQRAIAGALSDADGLIAALEGVIAKKRDLKQAAMQQLLTGKTRLPGFSGEWEVKRLGDLCEVDPDNLGSGTPPSYLFNYISLEDVNRGQLLGFSELEFRIAPSRARRKLKLDDILVSTVRPNLQAHLHFKNTEEDWVCSTGFAVLRCIEGKSSSGFIFQHLFGDGINQQIEKLITGSNYPAINSREVRALEISAPCVEEQTAIAEVLSDMDADLAALEARVAKARAVKQGMMQQLLTGKVRLI